MIMVLELAAGNNYHRQLVLRTGGDNLFSPPAVMTLFSPPARNTDWR